MRLTPFEIESIKKAFLEAFEDGKIYLFSSFPMSSLGMHTDTTTK